MCQTYRYEYRIGSSVRFVIYFVSEYCDWLSLRKLKHSIAVELQSYLFLCFERTIGFYFIPYYSWPQKRNVLTTPSRFLYHESYRKYKDTNLLIVILVLLLKISVFSISYFYYFYFSSINYCEYA